MTEAFLFFAAGFLSALLAALPFFRSGKKRIRLLEERAGEKEKAAALDRALEAARELRKAAAVLARDDPDSASVWNHAAGMEEIRRGVDENARIAAEIADKTGSVATIAAKMESDVLKGFSVLEKNVKKMADIQEKNSGVIGGIVSLGNKVNQIRDIVRVINTITGQTKVIAFNAALEAAGAGETGKRFAVVAAEVNRLADDIASLTRNIREQVEEIHSSSSSLVLYSEEGSDRIVEGGKLIKDLEDIFREIRSGAEITSGQARTITGSTREQRSSSEQVSQSISGISGSLRSLTGRAAALWEGVKKLSDLALDLEQYLDGQVRHGD
ncbi:MAG: methyl-accepting chemotaxis protein [Treponema sp.]|jgi:methyl-accepting chemotaxis protein|nr:methyl-accepting chemotaxis protein [Treponema sp.]